VAASVVTPGQDPAFADADRRHLRDRAFIRSDDPFQQEQGISRSIQKHHIRIVAYTIRTDLLSGGF
jgi:hypothetical protein